jgi:fructose-1,6-bisphosphatase II
MINESLLDELKKVTQNTALAAYPLFGKQKKNEADALAVVAMRESLNSIPAKFRVIIGEGEKDEAPMLYAGEILGKGGLELDIAVDPLECTTSFSKGLANSMSVLGFSETGGLKSVPGTYMEQWIAGPRANGIFKPEESIEKNVSKLSSALNKKLSELVIVVQDRPRHIDIIQKLRELDCGIALIDSGSLTATLEICLGYGTYDAIIGTYGAPEGLLSAIIATATNSEMKAILRPHTDKHTQEWKQMGNELGTVMDKEDLVSGEHIGFVATEIGGNQILRGLRIENQKAQGNTLLVTKKGSQIESFEKNLKES